MDSRSQNGLLREGQKLASALIRAHDSPKGINQQRRRGSHIQKHRIANLHHILGLLLADWSVPSGVIAIGYVFTHFENQSRDMLLKVADKTQKFPSINIGTVMTAFAPKWRSCK